MVIGIDKDTWTCYDGILFESEEGNNMLISIHDMNTGEQLAARQYSDDGGDWMIEQFAERLAARIKWPQDQMIIPALYAVEHERGNAGVAVRKWEL